MMSMSYEVFVEPFVSDGSNYASWSIHVLNHLRTLGSLAKRVVVASILPPNFSSHKIDGTSQWDLDCMQLNALATDYLLSVVCTELKEIILEDEEVWDNAHLIWKVLKDVCDKDCSASSVASIALQDTSFKSQEIKDSKKQWQYSCCHSKFRSSRFRTRNLRFLQRCWKMPVKWWIHLCLFCSITLW